MSVEEQFKAAIAVISGLPEDGTFQPSNEMKLKFYGLYKQATKGPCKEPKPMFYKVEAAAKWRAWSSCSDLSSEEAMRQYVEELRTIVEAMAYSEDVESFTRMLGPFYDYMDHAKLPQKCIETEANPDAKDTDKDSEDRSTTESEASTRSEAVEDLSESVEASSIKGAGEQVSV